MSKLFGGGFASSSDSVVRSLGGCQQRDLTLYKFINLFSLHLHSGRSPRTADSNTADVTTMASVEEQALELLRATQSPNQASRKNAEENLDRLKSKDDFAGALVTIGGHSELSVNDRLSALINLKKTINLAWSTGQDDYEGGELISNEARESIRSRLLSIVFGGNVDSKITSAAANDIAKIARSDFPEEWPNLLDSILGQLPQSGDDQTHAILVVLDELLSDGLEENSFYACANIIILALHQVATNDQKKLMVRAQAINVFRQCFDFVENLKDKEEQEIRTFTQTVCEAWSPFFLQVVQSPLPEHPSAEDEDKGTSEVAHHWRGVVALKIQVLLVGWLHDFYGSTLSSLTKHRRYPEFRSSSRI